MLNQNQKYKIGKAIKTVRESKGITITFIAGKLNKTPQWLSNIEKDRRGIDPTDLFEVAKILGVDVSIFFDQNYNKAFKPTGTDCN